MNQMDLLKMRIGLYHDLRVDLRGKYLLDKILHDDHKVSKEILETACPKVIFLLRRPESTLKSILNMARMPGMEGYLDPQKALVYYCSRLTNLVKYAQVVKGKYFFLESDDLVNNTDSVLRELSDWLELRLPLVNCYDLFNNTGKAGYGDRSEKIRTRKIVETNGYPELSIPPQVLQEAEYSYQRCKEKLSIDRAYN
ncbi:hypothetical protein LPB19_10720 [Marinobacter salinisoli]|uniref:Sulfotransferase domain-containing protein n=1 Tax=Marinobacter salinisoli TaxID=2769486 RepID=A0ABX7MQA5_9GAMM|nr:hypothetical protein [Marinobacter salinisoli]QSP93677.1 hypothetical protein LPB19_10720 [Marinobacter salinisoli]